MELDTTNLPDVARTTKYPVSSEKFRSKRKVSEGKKCLKDLLVAIPEGRGQNTSELFEPVLAPGSTSKVYRIFNMSALTRNNL